MENTDPADGDRVHLHTEWAWCVCETETQKDIYTDTHTDKEKETQRWREGRDSLTTSGHYRCIKFGMTADHTRKGSFGLEHYM